MTITVFYDERMNGRIKGAPSPSKPKKAVADWVKHDLDIAIHTFDKATREDFRLAHSTSYVDGVLTMYRRNGFGTHDAKFNESLGFTTGSMYAAAVQALLDGVACSPSSGFHHAGFDSGGGFCTFNGLMVTAMKLKKLDQSTNVGIIDCDFHYGNGTDDIIAEINAGVKHYTAGSYHHGPSTAARFLRDLPKVVKKMCDSSHLILYQAGADAHVDDPLGGFLTTEQMALRDRIVFETCRENRTPVAWNLAGGYQQPISKVLALHTQTMRICCEVYRD